MTAHTSVMTRILAVALVIVTVLPIVTFATDFTHSRTLRSARRGGLRFVGERPRVESEDAMRERIRVRRAQMHPAIPSVAMAMGFQLAMLSAIAAVGRRLFSLRL